MKTHRKVVIETTALNNIYCEKLTMNALGKYCHDFPRLAKESGYMFQLYRGRINWDDLDKLCVQEIINERNFELLEQNLIHVINCNLEREYDVKILDQNFVKLFKLAQLGIDYLSYCELYLDRCVILLQEQLTSYQEECTQLKDEIEKKDEELKKYKKKAKLPSQNYKCNKCSKIFLNETYLESHEKRRHRTESETNHSIRLFYADQAQQTDTEKESISVFTQTIDNTPASPDKTQGVTEILKINEQEMKIDNLKRDLEDLKKRLSLAEKTMEEKKNDERTFSTSFPSAVIPVIHSYISPTYHGQLSVIPATPTILPGIPTKQIPVPEQVAETDVNVKTVNKSECNESSINSGIVYRQSSFEETPRQKSSTPERVPAEGASTVGSGSLNSNDIFTNIYEGLKEEHENTSPHSPTVSPQNQILDVRPKIECKINAEPKTDPPKNAKSEMFLEVEKLEDDFREKPVRVSPICLEDDLKIESESLSESLEPRTSTPVRVTPGEIVWESQTGWDNEPNVSPEKRKRIRKSDLNCVETDGKSKSLFRNMVKKKSPKIRELKVNLRNSFTQLYGSIGKKTPEDEEVTFLNKTKSEIVEGLHKRLKDLGIDPEWSGIPKETMKQKLNILEHQRNLLSKERRLYPYLKRKLQKHVLARLKNNSLPLKANIQLPTPAIASELEPNGATSTEKILSSETNEITIYDYTDRDSDLDERPTKDVKFNGSSTCVVSDELNKPQNISLDSIEPIKVNMTLPGQPKWSEEHNETTNFSIFQAGKFKTPDRKRTEPEKPKVDVIVDDEDTDSDFDDELFRELERKSVEYTPDKSPRKDTIASFPARSDKSNSVESFRAKTEAQSILKSELDNKPQLNSKKKVLFAEEPEIFESSSKEKQLIIDKQKIFDMSSTVDDNDDDWSIESEWLASKE